MSGTTKRLFDHIRQVYKSQDWSDDLICRHNLKQCSSCLHWFRKFKQHSPKCASPTTQLPINRTRSQFSDSQPNVSRTSVHSNGYATSAQSNRSSAYDDAKHQEARAWDLISSLTINQILESLPPRSVRHIPCNLKATFQECVKVAFREIEANPMNESG